MFIVNGRFGKDKGIGETTFRDKSLIDYTLCSAESFEILNDFEVIELDSVFSDGHALLEWSIKCNNPINNVAPKSDFEPKFIWSESSKNNFIDNIDINEIRKLQAKLDNMQSQEIEHNVAFGSINSITNGIGEISKQAASTSLKQTKPPYKRRYFDKLWFETACKIARQK